MCKIIEDLVKEEREEGREEGREETMSATALRMLKVGKYPLEEISELSGLPLEKVKKLQAERDL